MYFLTMLYYKILKKLIKYIVNFGQMYRIYIEFIQNLIGYFLDKKWIKSVQKVYKFFIFHIAIFSMFSAHFMYGRMYRNYTEYIQKLYRNLTGVAVDIT